MLQAEVSLLFSQWDALFVCSCTVGACMLTAPQENPKLHVRGWSVLACVSKLMCEYRLIGASPISVSSVMTDLCRDVINAHSCF